MASEPGESPDNTANLDTDESAQADPYWVAQQATELRERAVHAAMHPVLAPSGQARPIDEVLADAEKILKFISGAE